MRLSSRGKLIGVFSVLMICVLSFALFSFLKFMDPSSNATTGLAAPAKTVAVTPPAKCGGWSIVPSAHPTGLIQPFFLGTAAVSGNDAWAVGYYHLISDGTTVGLIEHWNGTAWSVVSHPNPAPGQVSEGFNAVAALSATDVWVVGEYTDMHHIQRTRVEHWDGTRWSIVVSPNADTSWNKLNAITVISPYDVWAVGNFSGNGGTLYTLTEHWDGTRWSIVVSPNASSDTSNLRSVAAVSAHDVWAVGDYLSRAHSLTQPLIEHWNGTAWSIVTNPSPDVNEFATYEAVTALSAQDVWAVGAYSTAKNNIIMKGLIEHWDGTSWKIVPGPDVQKDTEYLIDITAISPTNLWVVGTTEGPGEQQALIGHWDGTKWRVVPPANLPDKSFSILRGIAHVPGTSYIWAVGLQGSMRGSAALTEFYC